MTTNKPDVKRYDCTSEDSYHCHGCFTMKEQLRGDYVEWEDYEALQAECEKLRKHLQNLIDQTTPLEPEPGNPMWSRRIQLDEVIAERDQLRAECEKLRKDAERIEWLEDQAKKSWTGISFDYHRYAEDGYVVNHGYRFMRRHFASGFKDSLRKAIDAAMQEDSQ